MQDKNKAVYPADRDTDYDSYESKYESKPAQYKTESGRKRQPPPKKKKAGCCFKTCLSGMIFALIILVGGIGVGWYFGDAFLKENYDVSLKEAFRVVGNLKDYRKARDKIKEGFKASDADGFVDSLGDALLLNRGALTKDEIKDILLDLTDDVFKTDSESEKESALTIKSFMDENDGDSENKNQKYVQMLIDLYSKEDNFNKEKIADYKDGEDVLVTVHGSELAAFLNNVLLNSMFENETFKAEINKSLGSGADFVDINDFDFKDILQIKQVAFYKNNDNTTGVTLTTQTNFKKLVKSGVKNLNAMDLKIPVNGFLESLTNGGIGFGGWLLTQFILPKELYLTIDMPLSQASPAKISLNNTDQKDWETLRKIAKEMKITLIEDFDKAFLPDGGVGKAITNINKQASFAEMIDNKSGKGGVIQCDLIEIALEFMKVNYYDEPQVDINGDPVLGNDGLQKKINKRYADEDCLNSKDIYSSFRDLIASDVVEAMDAHGKEKDHTRYTYKKDENGKFILKNGLPVWEPDGFDGVREGALIDDALDNKLKEYEQLFIDALSVSYGLKDGVTFDQLFDMLMSGENSDLNSIFDSAVMGDKMTGKAAETGAIITDKMLAAIIAKRMDKFMGGGESPIDLDSISPRYVVLTKEQIENQYHSFAEIGIEVNLLKLLESKEGGAGAFGAIIAAILPESILICAKIDITLDKPDSFYLPVQLSIDRLNFGDDGMMRILKVFNRLNVFGGQSMDDYMSQMLSKVTDIIKTMEENMPGLSLEESQINLPDPLELVTSMLNKSMGLSKENEITRDELKENMEFILDKIDVPAFTADGGLSAYLNWVYALTSDMGITELLDVFGTGQDQDILDKFDMDKIIDMSEENSSYYTDKITDFELEEYEDVNSYDAIINAERLGQLLLDYAAKNDSVEDYLNPDTLKFVGFYSEGSEKYIKMILELESSTLMNKGNSDSANPSTEFFAAVIGKIYMTVLIDITPNISKEERDSKVILNSGEAGTEKLIEFIKKLGIDLESVRNDVLKMLEDNVVDMFDKVNGSGVVELKMSDKGDALVITNVFDAMANIMVKNKTDEQKLASKISGTEMQSVIYGMYKPETDAKKGLDSFTESNPIPAEEDRKTLQGLLEDKNLQGLIAEKNNVIPGTSDNIEISFADYELGGIMASRTTEIGKLLSLNIISANDDGAKAQRERVWLDGFDSAINWENNNYISLIFEIPLRGQGSFLGEAGNSSVAQKVFRENQKVYGTILIKEKNAAELAENPEIRYELTWFRLNEMDKATQSCLYKLSDVTDSITGTIDSYFDKSSYQFNRLLGQEMQEKIGAFSQPPLLTVTMAQNSFVAALPLPDKSVGSYQVTVNVAAGIDE